MADFGFNVEDTLLTGYDVIKAAPADAHSHAEERCKYIPLKEEKLFNLYFGWQFYLDLLADKYKYAPDASGDRQYSVFAEGTSYAASDFVLFQGEVYKVIKNTTGTQTPYNGEYFQVAERFKKQEFEFLWRRYLRRLLAWAVLNTSVMYRLIKDTPKGVVKNYDDGESVPATVAELQAFKRESEGDLNDLIDNMEAFIKRHPDVFSSYKNFGEDCEPEGKHKRKKRHWGFSTTQARI